MKLEDLTPELKEKVLACKTPEDLLALAKGEDYELSDEELEAVSGGFRWSCDDYASTCTEFCRADNWC